MKNKPLLFAVAGLVIALVLLLVWWTRHPSTADSASSQTSILSTPAVTPFDSLPSQLPPANSSPVVARPSRTQTPTATSTSGTTAVAPVPGANSLPPTIPASPPPFSNANPAQQSGMIGVEKTRRIIVDYHTLMGENPVGTNAEIMKAVMGDNPRQATLGPKEGQELNDKGELIDQWGTPYFFHQLSRDRMEIHSAGPDKVMGTKDDLVLQ